MMQLKHLATLGVGGAVGAQLVGSGGSAETVSSLGVAIVFIAIAGEWVRQNVLMDHDLESSDESTGSYNNK